MHTEQDFLHVILNLLLRDSEMEYLKCNMRKSLDGGCRFGGWTFGGQQMAVGRLAARDKWLLGLLAVGPNGGQDIWRPRHLEGDEWRLGHLAARPRQIPRIWAKWLLGHLAARADP